MSRSMRDITLPPNYSATFTADGAELYLPNGNVLYHYGPAWSPECIEDDAWTHHVDVCEGIEVLERLLDSSEPKEPETPIRIILELTARLGLSEAEENGYRDRCMYAVLALQQEIMEELAKDADWVGGSE